MLGKDFRYPHLLPIDANVWRQHHLAHGDKYTQLDYDVRVGEGRDPGSEYDTKIRHMALALSCRRIDVVGHSNSGLDIIEVTHSAGLKAIGQLISYPILYSLTYPTIRPIRPILVAGEIQTDILPVLTRLRIEFYVYPPPYSPSEPRSQFDS